VERKTYILYLYFLLRLLSELQLQQAPAPAPKSQLLVASWLVGSYKLLGITAGPHCQLIAGYFILHIHIEKRQGRSPEVCTEVEVEWLMPIFLRPTPTPTPMLLSASEGTMRASDTAGGRRAAVAR